MKVKIITKDIFGKEYRHKIDNVFSMYDNKDEIFIRYMNGDTQDAFRFLKENVITLEVKI